ncbi:transcriptional regulator, RpiR family [Rhodoferax sp. OV413]|uniref:MurR/RpiR family transcriptional regulator n=1 Tax=Rhodoferax sp. OV413 TaxID=1855285 RepID=UPI0008899BD2|nr:MurR/RpiR family transcriptional regulator [Rhodoferax sp. OV413]SDN98357.1 transcriptional regulator, RpiR family [Rhodoferax sp. OV413]
MSNSKPRNLDALRDLIGRESERLTPRMRDAARYAIDHPNDMALNPVATVAGIAKIAPAAFIRMAKALGFDGYSDLQRLFREPLQHAVKPTFKERIRHFGGEQTLDNPDDPAEVLRAFSQANVVSLEHLQDDAASMPLQEAIALIQNARIVHVLGLRRSYAVAAYLAYALNRVGQPAVQITGLGGAITEQASTAGPQDLLIAISFPPYAADTLQVCEQIRQSGAKRLAITDAFMSPVAKDADLVLEVNDAKLLGFRSLTSAMCLAQTLAMGLAFAKRSKRSKRAGTQPTLAADLQDIDC